MITNNSEGQPAPKYVYLEQGDKDALCPIMITEGPFEGFVYQYGVVKVEEIEDNNDEGAKLSFDYQLIEVPHDYQVTEDEDEEKVQFETVIGDILTDIITNYDVDDGYDVNDDRETDTQ